MRILMLYNVSFDIAAIILNVMLLLIIYLRRTYPTKSCNFYKGMLWFNLISSCADFISAYTISYADVYPLALNYIVNMCYLLSHNLTGVLFLLYVITLIRGNLGTKAERIFWGSVILFDFLAVTTSPFTKFIFYFDENRVYCHGPLMPLLYLAAGLILFYALFLFIRHRDVLNIYQMTTNITFLSLLMGTVLYQVFFPYVLIESFSGVVAMLMMNVALDNPAIYFYRNSTCFNGTAFETMVGGRLSDNETISAVAFTYDDLSIFKKKYGDAVYEAMIDATIRTCHKAFGQKHLYFLSDGCFAVDIGNRKVGDCIKKLTNLLEDLADKDGKPYELTPHFCIFRHPGCAETVSEVTDAITYMLFDGYRKTGERVLTVDKEQLTRERREAQIVHLLHNAVANDEFLIHYQPIYEVKTGKFSSAEALVRLKSDELGYISPEEFIPIAEQNGLILEIGDIVFEKVCRFWKENDPASYGIQYLEVNLSKLQMLHPATADRLCAICRDYGVSPSCINLEITETISADETESKTINQCIDRLCAEGFTFSLDDYGSGYANASYLAEMPFRFIKIDKGILWNAMKNDQNRIVLKSVVRLIADLGRTCIVEGVENGEMAKLLTELGCGLFQGYLYSRPVPEKELLHFLEQNREAYGAEEYSG